MHSFPQFTRSTLCAEFARVGAIIFGGTFLVMGQFSLREIILGGNYPWGNYPGDNHPVGNYPGGNLLRG